jgi:hypothetical protein
MRPYATSVCGLTLLSTRQASTLERRLDLLGQACRAWMALSEQEKRAQEEALPLARERENTFCRPHRRDEDGGAGSAPAAPPARGADRGGGERRSDAWRSQSLFELAGLWVLVVRALRVLAYASCIHGNFGEAMAANAQALHIEQTLGAKVPEGMLGVGGCGISAVALCGLGELVHARGAGGAGGGVSDLGEMVLQANECQDVQDAAAASSGGRGLGASTGGAFGAASGFGAPTFGLCTGGRGIAAAWRSVQVFPAGFGAFGSAHGPAFGVAAQALGQQQSQAAPAFGVAGALGASTGPAVGGVCFAK